MQSHQPSQTAAWVAAARTLGTLLPRSQQLAHDPYGNEFLGGIVRRASDALLNTPELFRLLVPGQSAFYVFLLWMQLRTRALDDILREFIASGGHQVVLLGAGYDVRAVRFAHLLREANVFEVDHPATQAHKRATVKRSQLRSTARYVPWDFETGTQGLAHQLYQAGLSRHHRVLTICEGVTMYLTERAIEETFALVKEYGASSSWFAFTYLDQRALRKAQGDQRITQRIAKSIAGEPHRFGFKPRELSGWLHARGYTLLSDVSDRDLAARHFDSAQELLFGQENRHVALARVG